MTALTAASLAAAAGTWAFAGGAGDVTPAPDDQRAARVELGRRLFFDPIVSRTGRFSCAQCHDPGHGFTDMSQPSLDEFGPMARRSMPLTDLPQGPMHSDGEFKDVRDLLGARLLPFDDLDNERRLATLSRFGIHFDAYGNPDGVPPALVPVAQRVTQDGLYARAFTAAYGNSVPTIDRVMESIDAYVASLRTQPNAFDRFIAGEEDALTPSARRGLALFTGKASCATCHLVEPVDGRAPLRDGKFHDTGVSWRTALAQGSDDPARDGDQGRAAHERRGAEKQRDRMRFKTPSLRDVGKRGPFMHDGSLATLADVIAMYDKGGTRHPGLDPAIRRLDLTPDEKDDLLSFLFALSGPDRAGIAAPPVRGGRTTTVRLVEPDGRPIAGAAVGVEPEGDRFSGEAATTALLRTDARGRITFAFPNCTHVRLRVEGHGVANGRLLPDVSGDVDLIAVPQDSAALRVLSDGEGLPRQIRAVPMLKVDAVGRPAEPREGDSLVFTLARALSADEGVYVARLDKDVRGSTRRTLVPRGGNGSVTAAQADVDVTGGAMTYVDLRPPLTAKSAPVAGGERR